MSGSRGQDRSAGTHHVPPESMVEVWEAVTEAKAASVVANDQVSALVTDRYRAEAAFMRDQERLFRRMEVAYLNIAESTEAPVRAEFIALAELMQDEQVLIAKRRTHYEVQAMHHPTTTERIP